VRRGGRFPGDQAEVVFSDVLIEQLEELSQSEKVDVLAEIVRWTVGDPAGLTRCVPCVRRLGEREGVPTSMSGRSLEQSSNVVDGPRALGSGSTR